MNHSSPLFNAAVDNVLDDDHQPFYLCGDEVLNRCRDIVMASRLRPLGSRFALFLEKDNRTTCERARESMYRTAETYAAKRRIDSGRVQKERDALLVTLPRGEDERCVSLPMGEREYQIVFGRRSKERGDDRHFTRLPTFCRFRSRQYRDAREGATRFLRGFCKRHLAEV